MFFGSGLLFLAMMFGCDGGRRRAGFDETRALPDPAAHVEVVDFGKMVVLTTSDVSMWVTLMFRVWVLVVSGLFLVRAGVIEVAPRRGQP